MNKKTLLLAAGIAISSLTCPAQRATDQLGRGLVAVKTPEGVFCSWRINADEWEGTQYNLYRGSTKLNDTPLNVSNFTDSGGTVSDTYSVKAVADGKESSASPATKVWESNYTILKPQHAPEIQAGLVPNDATLADVDGDGELELIMKYDNQASSYHDGDNGIFTVIECLEMDGSVKWWINFGPNIGDFQNNEINIIAFDWDKDGKAEVAFRAADGTTIHHPDGTTYTVGDAGINYRGNDWPSGQWFMHWGREWLVYADGENCKPYECIDFPLKRVEDTDNPSGLLSGSSYDKLVDKEWGDGYGHRSSKYFFAAPFLDGRNASLFLARGIYTKHKMIAYDIDPATHQLKERWRWNDLGGDWYGQGYHNFGVADVDWDGRDEIVFGSMVIDDNGMGLSTTGLGHGDAQHCGDFDPYSHGQEIFCCNEDNPNNNFRDATTSKIYYRTTGGNDDGRSNMGNFIDEYPGAEGISSKDDALIGGASHKAIQSDSKATVSITQNFRVYWDGDLCDESFDYSNGKNTAGAIFKAKQGRIALLEGSKTNNDTKGTPCFQGDILGDWREEYVMRDKDNNIRIYTTDIPTEHRIYSLWYDHQYRNAMCWQMCGYNQPPHVSFALSEYEGLTTPPPPLSMTGRTEVANNGTIDASLTGKNAIICQPIDMEVAVAGGASPASLTLNTPSWVQGHNNNDKITTTYSTHTLAGGTLEGSMKLTKQGDGILRLSTVPLYSGDTEIWAGTLATDNDIPNSRVWLNRFGILETGTISIPKGLEMNYGSILRLGNADSAASLTTSQLTLGFGSIVELDVFSNHSIDGINASILSIEKKDWTNGPEYLTPIVKFQASSSTEGPDMSGRYLIGEIGEIRGDLHDLVVLGLEDMKKELVYEGGKLYLDLSTYRPGDKTWTGGENAFWDLDHSEAFTNDANGEKDVFVPGDNVVFDDSALTTDIIISGRLQPGSVTFKNNDKDYTLSGEGTIVGSAKLVKEGNATLTVGNINEFTGGTYINGGKVIAGTFANNIGTNPGALSDVNTRIYLNNGATLATNATATLSQRITLQSGDGALEVPEGLKMTTTCGIGAGGVGQKLYKRGKGALELGAGNGMTRLVIEEGAVYATEENDRISLPSTVEFVKGSLYDPANIYTYSTNPTNYYVGAGNSGSLYVDSRCSYTGKLTGEGTLSVYASSVRTDLKGDWSGFEGTLVVGYFKQGSYDPDFKWDNSYGLPKATMSINKDVVFNAQNQKMTLGNLKGGGTYRGTSSLTIGNDETAISFNGKFAGNPEIVKKGECDLYLSSAWSGLKSLTAIDGTVSLTASKSPYNTTFLTAPLTIEERAMLRGRGTVGNLEVNAGGILEPGTYSDSKGFRYGPIYSSGNVSINPDATLSLYLRTAGKSNDCSYIEVSGQLSIDGIVKIEKNPDYVPAAGDQFTLWTAGSFRGTPVLELPTIPEGLQWDTTGLTDGRGVLKVAEWNAVDSPEAWEIARCRVYDTMGVLIGEIETPTVTAAETAQRTLRLGHGIYILRFDLNGKTRTLKVNY